MYPKSTCVEHLYPPASGYVREGCGTFRSFHSLAIGSGLLEVGLVFYSQALVPVHVLLPTADAMLAAASQLLLSRFPAMHDCVSLNCELKQTSYVPPVRYFITTERSNHLGTHRATQEDWQKLFFCIRFGFSSPFFLAAKVKMVFSTLLYDCMSQKNSFFILQCCTSSRFPFTLLLGMINSIFSIASINITLKFPEFSKVVYAL